VLFLQNIAANELKERMDLRKVHLSKYLFMEHLEENLSFSSQPFLGIPYD
jgi:hypothetical protein